MISVKIRKEDRNFNFIRATVVVRLKKGIAFVRTVRIKIAQRNCTTRFYKQHRHEKRRRRQSLYRHPENVYKEMMACLSVSQHPPQIRSGTCVRVQIAYLNYVTHVSGFRTRSQRRRQKTGNLIYEHVIRVYMSQVCRLFK